MELQKHTETIPDIKRDWRAFVEYNAMHRDINEVNFYQKANVDISFDKNRSDKMVGDDDLVQRIAKFLDAGLDFGLKNDAGGYVFFIRKQFMITWHPKDANQNQVFNLANTTEFENRLKVSILFHPEFVPPAMIKINAAYRYLVENMK